MPAFNPTIETEVQSRPPGPAPMQDNSSAIALGGITQAVKILGSKFGGTRGNTGPSKADQTVANNKGFMQGVQKIQAMKDQGASTQQVQIAQQTLLKNSVNAGIDLSDKALSSQVKALTGTDIVDYGTTLTDRAARGDTLEPQEQLALTIAQQTNVSDEEAMLEAQSTTAIIASNAVLEEQLAMGAKKEFGEIARSRMDKADELFKSFQYSLGIALTDEGGIPLGLNASLTEADGAVMMSQAQAFKAQYDRLPPHTDPNNPNVKNYLDYGQNMFTAMEGLVKLTSLEVQNNTERQNFNKLLKAYASQAEADGTPVNPVTLAALLVSKNGDLMKLLADDKSMSVFMSDIANIKLQSKVPRGTTLGVNVEQQRKEVNEAESVATEAGEDLKTVGKTLTEQIYARDTTPSEMVDHMKYNGTWAKFSKAEFIDATPEGKKTYIDSAVNLGLIMSSTEKFMSKEFLTENFPSDNLLNNLQHIEKTDPESANFVRNSVAKGLEAQKGFLEQNIEEQLGKSIFPYEFDEEKGKYFVDKDAMTRANNGTIFANEVRERGLAVGYEVSEDGNRLYVPDDHSGRLKSIRRSKETLGFVEGLQSNWSPEEPEVTTDAPVTPDQTGDVVKEDLPPAGPAEAEVPAAAEDESGVPIPADRPSDLGELGLSEETATTLNNSGVTIDDSMDVAVAKLTKDNNDPKSILSAMSELVEKQEAKVMAYATQESPELPAGQRAIQDATSGATQEAEVFDFITQAEGTEKTDEPYSTTLGYGEFIKGGERDLTKVPLGEIDRLQTEILNNPKNKTGGSPVGKYQVVQRTLRDAKKALGLKDTDLFTKEVQDKVGMWLLNRRGYQDWKDGKISDAQFTKNMQNEWQALKVKPEFMEQILATKKGTDINSNPQQLKSSSLSEDAGVAELSNQGVANPEKVIKSKTPYELSKGLLGYSERNKEHNSILSAFIKENAGININPAKTAWCAAFVNAVLGAKDVKGTGKLNARSFLKWGDKVTEPKKGDVVIFSRGDPNGWQGHVGFFQGYDSKGNIKVLGGNQSNKVNIQTYNKSKLLGFRRST